MKSSQVFDPLVPAKAGTQLFASLAGFPLARRLRGNEWKKL